MGNRAVITTNSNLGDVGIYLHWNGGRNSIEAFLAYCNLKRYRTGDYGMALLAGVITNFLGNGLSCGVDVAHNLDCDNHDNGVYIIADWYIVGRMYDHGEQLDDDLRSALEYIDTKQPEHMRLTAEEWQRFDEVNEQTILMRK